MKKLFIICCLLVSLTLKLEAATTTDIPIVTYPAVTNIVSSILNSNNANASGLTNASGRFANSETTLSADNNATNFWLSATGSLNQIVWATTNLNFAYVTNIAGDIIVRIRSTSGYPRVAITFPTTWNFGTTNDLGLTNGYYTFPFTNIASHASILRLHFTGTGTDQTNVVVDDFKIGQP